MIKKGLHEAIYFSGLAITGIYGGFRGVVDNTGLLYNDKRHKRVFGRTMNMISGLVCYSIAYVVLPIWVIPYSVEYYSQKYA